MNEEKIDIGFWGKVSPEKLIIKYGSPLYVYSENILRERCREIKNMIPYDWFHVNYSAKANSNISLLRIIKDEGLNSDAMSPGEIHTLLKAGFLNEQLLYIGNNVSKDEMLYAVNNKIMVSVDSLSQLETYGRINPQGKVALRINPGIGAGHHEKVVTAGSKTKFGIQIELLEEAKLIADKYSLKITGINQHIGSLFLEGSRYLEGVQSLLNEALKFPELEFIDLGGGFGIPYRKCQNEKRLDLKSLSDSLADVLISWRDTYNDKIKFIVEPGRYIVAECGVLLGEVHSVKNNYDVSYIGTDIGFNVLSRPILYDSYHEMTIYRNDDELIGDNGIYTIVGNICESGDILAKNRELPKAMEGDILAIMDAGAYGYSMCSNYNQRLRPAEVLINENGEDILIRRRDTLDDIIQNQIL